MRVESDGVGLHVEVDGPDDGSPVVFLHGLSGSAPTYDWLPPEITKGRRIVRIDFRGHGSSDHAPGTYVLDNYVADVVTILREVVRRPAVVVGHSLGGVVGWTLAQRHPDLVSAAVLEDPPLYLGEPDEHAANPAAKVFAQLADAAVAWQEEGIDAATAAARLGAAPFGPDPSRTMADTLTEDGLAARGWAFLQLDPGVLRAGGDGSTLAATDTASPVAVPVLILASDDACGAAFAARHAERLAATHPEVVVERVPGAAHWIHDGRDHRTAYVEHLARFLDEHA
jgi:pimeloyl-ACP methyl ester carboxylesterase